MLKSSPKGRSSAQICDMFICTGYRLDLVPGISTAGFQEGLQDSAEMLQPLGRPGLGAGSSLAAAAPSSTHKDLLCSLCHV